MAKVGIRFLARCSSLKTSISVNQMFWINNPDLSVTSQGAWSYWRPGAEDLPEMAMVRGIDVALPQHFHGEDQITFVVSGRRRFLMNGELVIVEAGHGLCIPAGTPHGSMLEPDGVLCFNFYLPIGEYAATALLHDLKARRHKDDQIPYSSFLALVEGHRLGQAALRAVSAPSPISSSMSVHLAAKRAGMSREGFSRAFRRSHGMPPQSYKLMSKLNVARDLLKGDMPIAEVAAATGFADQSHLGRCFRRAFGVSPARYRVG